MSLLVDVDFEEWARIEAERAQIKWEARVCREAVGKLPRFQVQCDFKWLPKELIKFINLQNVFCRVCRAKLSPEHYAKHGVSVPDVETLLEELANECATRTAGKGDELTREEFLDASARYINVYIVKMLVFASEQMSIKCK